MRRVLKWLRPEEWLCVAFAAILAVLTTFFTGPDYGWRGLWHTFRMGFRLSMQRDIPFFSSHMTFFLLLALVTYLLFLGWSLIGAGPGRRAERVKASTLEFLALLRAYVPFLACYVVYALLRDMIPHISRRTMDGPLAWMETRSFGTLVCTATFQALHSDAATWVLARCYASHFYAPPLVAFLFFLRRDFRNFRDFMLAIIISAFASYLGYILVPAGGLRYALADWAVIRASQAGDPTLRFVDFWAETAADCFPSMHTAWTVVSAIYLFRLSKTLFAIYAPIGTGLVIACLYFGYHYLIDIPAGALTALGAIYAAAAIHRWWYANVRDLAGVTGRLDERAAS